jgi:hypothetical protein
MRISLYLASLVATMAMGMVHGQPENTAKLKPLKNYKLYPVSRAAEIPDPELSHQPNPTHVLRLRRNKNVQPLRPQDTERKSPEEVYQQTHPRRNSRARPAKA